jgi:hypothetical protein
MVNITDDTLKYVEEFRDVTQYTYFKYRGNPCIKLSRSSNGGAEWEAFDYKKQRIFFLDVNVKIEPIDLEINIRIYQEG